MWILTGGLFSAGIRGAHDNRHLGSLLVDPYWVGFYITNFQDGFRRRALIGTISRWFQPHGMSVILINLLAVFALMTVLALFVRAFLRLSSAEATTAPLFGFALFASAIGSIYFEVLGDTLQIAFLLFALFTLLPARYIHSAGWREFLAFMGLILAFFVHEASAFLLAPCIPFLVGRHVNLRSFTRPAITLVFLIGLSTYWSHVDTHLTYHALSVPRNMPLERLASTPDFRELLRLERQDDFGSPSKFLYFLVKAVSILGLAAAGLIAFATCLSYTMLRRMVGTLAAILIFSGPLWIVAHDWGRFLAYSFFLAALAASFQPHFEIAFVPRLLADVTARLEQVSRVEAYQCTALLFLLASPYNQSRIFGMHIRDLLSGVVIVGVGALIVPFARRSRMIASDYTGTSAKEQLVSVVAK